MGRAGPRPRSVCNAAQRFQGMGDANRAGMRRTSLVLSCVLAALVAVATASALFSPHGGPHMVQPTVRGEDATYQGSGLYRFDPVEVAREGLVWDAINLFIAVPAFLFALHRAWRGSTRGRLAVAGLSLYFAYAYLQYAAMMAVNPLFLAYAGIIALGAVNVGLTVTVPRLSERFPRKLFIGFSFSMAIALVLLWGRLVMGIVTSGHLGPQLAGLTGLPSQALDLGMVVPLAVTAGVLLLRGHAYGPVLTSLVLTFGTMMFITVPAWIVVPAVMDRKLDVIEAVPFLALCAFGIALEAIFFRNVDG
jgi:hypothetical protein